MKARLPILGFFAVSILAVVSVLPALASQVEPQDSFEFSCVIWEPLSFPELFYRNGAEFLPLKLALGCRSDLHLLKNTSALELHVRKETPDGKTNYELVGLAPNISGVVRMLFFIEDAEDAHGLSLKLSGLDDSLKVFPPGTFRFVNETQDDLMIVFGGVTTSLDAGSIEIVNSGVDESGGFLPISLQSSEGDRLSETRLFCQANARQMIFIHPPVKDGGRLKMRFLSELVPISQRVKSADE